MPLTNLVDRYESLLVENLSAVRSIESGLRNVTWLLPGRFEDAEIASEGLYALLNVVSGYHDGLLSKHLDPSLSLPPRPFDPPPPSTGTTPPNRTSPALPPPSDHARYTKYWTEKSSIYRKASRLSVTLNYVELLVEMIAKKRVGDRRRWRFVAGIEGMKTLLRLIIMVITKRAALSHPTPQREYDLLSLPSSLLKSSKLPTQPSSTTVKSTQPPYAAVTSTIPPFAPLRSHLFPLSSALPESHLAHPLTLLPELSTPGQWTAELIEASVTLLQVILLIRASRRPQTRGYQGHSLPTLSSHLSPWAIPILLSLLARQIRKSNRSNSTLLAEHDSQLDRRLAARVFLTGPMWVGWTRPKIVGIATRLGRIPLVGLVGELIEGYLPLVDDYFYYTSS